MRVKSLDQASTLIPQGYSATSGGSVGYPLNPGDTLGGLIQALIDA